MLTERSVVVCRYSSVFLNFHGIIMNDMHNVNLRFYHVPCLKSKNKTGCNEKNQDGNVIVFSLMQHK
jgi:hypothetical protein